eukprot:211359-Pleurochrysis_carterae.AAC.2
MVALGRLRVNNIYVVHTKRRRAWCKLGRTGRRLAWSSKTILAPGGEKDGRAACGEYPDDSGGTCWRIGGATDLRDVQGDASRGHGGLAQRQPQGDDGRLEPASKLSLTPTATQCAEHA